MGLNVTYPEIVWPKTPPSPGAAPLLASGDTPEAYKQLQADGVPQNPVAGVPPQLIPPNDDALEEPGVPVFQPDPNGGKPTLRQVPDDRKSVTGETVKTEATGWMKGLNHFGDVKELGISFKRGALQAVPDFIMGVNAEVQGTRIANSVGLGENDMANFKEFAPTLNIALENKDDAAREASRQRILAVVDKTLGEAGVERRSSARHFVNAAFDDPKFLDQMTERSKFRYNVFTDPVMQAAFQMQENIEGRNPQDMKFVGTWADMLAQGAGTMVSAIAGRKVGGATGGAAFLAYQGAGQEFEKAIKSGASPEIAFKAASVGRFIGLTDVLPIERLVASPKVTKALFALALSAGKQAMIEGGQEGFQQYMSNVLAKTLYKPDQSVSQDIWENVVLGAVLGAGADLATGGFRQELAKTPEQFTEEALGQSAPFKGPASDAVPPAAPLNVADIQAKPGSYDPATWDKRPDGTDKGNGFLGVLQRPDGGVSSEISIGVQIGGKEMDIPLLVPTLTRPEIDTILALDGSDPEFFKKLPPGVIEKAATFAEQRIAAGLPVFAGSAEKPVQPNSPGEPPMVPATGAAGKPASPTATTVAFTPPAPMKVGDISKLPPDQRAIEADYVMAHDFNLVEPIQSEVAAGTPVEDISAKIEPLLLPVKEYLARRGVTDAAEVKVELDGMVRNIIAKLAPEGSPQAPSRALAGEEVSAAVAPSSRIDLSPPSPENGMRRARDVTIDGATIAYSMKPLGDGWGIDVSQVYVEPADRRKGKARKAMEKFIAEADAAGLPIFLTAEPYGKVKGPNKFKIEKFYSSLGFKPNTGGKADLRVTAGMRRDPGVKPAPQAAAKPAHDYTRLNLQTTDEQLDETFPKAAETVSGLKVRAAIPNQSSIEASIGNPEILPGVREVFIDAFEDSAPPANPDQRTKDLAAEIRASGEINPLIVAVDSDGPYILEGSHRLDALKLNGVTSFPALVVLDIDSLQNEVSASVAPTGPPDQTDTGRFKAWFGDSKVVDEAGEPLVVYHGSPSGRFNVFDPGKKGVTSVMGIPIEVHRQGFFFAEREGFAEGFATQSRGRQKGAVVPVYLSIQNPLDVTSTDNASHARLAEVAAQMQKADPTITNPDFISDRAGYDSFWELLDTDEGGADLVDAAKALGYDGIKMIEPDLETTDPNYEPNREGAVTWVAFEPTQIKSATDNSGAFDPANPDITAALPLKPKGVRHAYIHERIRPQKGIVHQTMVNGQSVVDIAKKFKDALGLVVQVGRYGAGMKGAEAIFKWGQSVVRVKNETDLTTLFHEGGHHLHQMMGNPLNAVITKHRAELEHIATHYYGGGGQIDTKNKSLIEKEGFAHFFQVYVNNPVEARNIAPGFAPDFEALLDKDQPGVRKALTEIIKAVDVQITQKSSMQIALEHVSPGTKPGNIRRIVEAAKGGNLMHEIGTLINRAYMATVGGEFALQHTVHALAAIAESNYRVLLERGEMSAAQVKIAIDRLSKVGKSDPVKMYWAAKNSAMRSAEFLHSGVQKFNTTDYKAVSKGFAEIMANVVGSARGHLHEETVHAFDAYLMARRIRSERQNHKATMAWMRRGGKASGLPPPPIIRANDPDSSFSEGDTNQSIADFEKAYPRFKQAADDVYGFLKAMIEYRRDAGDFTKEEADYMLAFEDYVPVHRVIEDLKRLSGAGQGVDGKSNGIKQFKGSGRQIVSPLRSIWQMTHQQLDVSMKNEMKLALVNMALDIGQGTGALIEKIPDTQMTGTTVNLSELLKAAGHIDLSAAGVQVQGTDIQDLNELADEIMSGDETATIWRPGDINEKGEHIIYVRRHGKREAYKLNDPAWADDLYRTLTDLAPPQRTMLVHILSAPARALRWGVVTEPVYQLANVIRDGFTTMVLQPGTLPFQVIAQFDKKGLKNHLYRSEMQKLYNLSGTTIAGRGIEALDKRKFGIEQGFLAKHGINLKDIPLAGGVGEVVRTFYSSEALGRQGLFARSYERAIKDGLAPHDALVEAGYTTSDYANYGRGGSRMSELRAIIPFLGAGIQGLDKFGRAAFGGTALPAAMRKQLMPYMNRMLNLEGSKTSLPLSKAEAESFKYSMKVQAAMFTLGIASMLLDSAYWGDEEYEQFSPYLRGTRWLIKIGPGQWLGIPKPFQYSFYSTLFSYGIDSVFKGDTTAMMKFLESQLYVTALPYENPGIGLAYELAFNKDLFTGRDIVPQNLAARPWRMQSDIYTSQLGKALGQVTGLSPMVIDHVITSSFATWGRSAMSLSNLTDSTKPEQGLEDYAFTRYFVKNGSRSTTVKPAFWNLVGQSTGNLVGAYSAFRDLMDGGAAGQAQQYLSGATDDEKVYTLLNYYQKPEAKKLHPLRNANDMVTALSAMRKEITASNFKLDGGEGERLVLSPTIQRQLNDRLSALGVREMRNALVLTDQPGFGGKRIMPTLSIYKEIEAIDGRVARELKNRLGSKVYSFDKLRQMWPQVRTEILLHGEHAKLTPFVSQARAGGKNYFTEGDAQP